jgi:hypothetical protein
MQWDVLSCLTAQTRLFRPPILIPQFSYKSLSYSVLCVEHGNTEHAGYVSTSFLTCPD